MINKSGMIDYLQETLKDSNLTIEAMTTYDEGYIMSIDSYHHQSFVKVKTTDYNKWFELKMAKIRYRKTIKITSTGKVVAEVFVTTGGEYGRRTGLKFYNGFTISNKSIEKRCKKAHKWADAYMILCNKQETS